jgi:hypothetical protein
VIAIAGQTGAGFDAWRTLLEEDGAANRNIVEIDYDTYAEGEAELGWLNMDLALDAGAPFDSDALARDLVDSLVDALALILLRAGIRRAAAQRLRKNPSRPLWPPGSARSLLRLLRILL